MEGKFVFQSTDTSINVKVDFREDIRRFNWVLSSLASLRNEISKRYALDSESRLVLKYKDEEGDLVTLTTDEDLVEAARIVRSTNGILKLHLVKGKIWGPVTSTAETSTAASQPAAQVPPSSAPSPRTVATPFDAPKEHKRLMRDEAWKLKAEARLLKKAEREAHKAEKDKERKEKNEHSEKVHHHNHCRKWEEKGTSRLDKHSARFVKDVGVQEGAEVAPGSTFVKTWRFRNEGSVPWPEGCTLAFVSRFEGDRMGAPESVPVPSAAIEQEVDVSVTMTAPTEPGRYAGFWRLTTPEGRKFGHRVRVLVHVVGSSSSSESEEEHKASWGDLLAQLEGLGFTDKELNLKLLHRHNCDVSKVVARLLKKKERKEKKEKKDEKKEKKDDKKHDKTGKKTPKK